MPAIIATVEWAGRSGWLDRIPRMSMPSALISAEHRECPPDVGDAGVSHLLLAQSLRCHERHEQALVFDEHVVELPDEMPGQLLLVGLLGDDRLPRPAEIVDEAGEGKDEGLAEQRRLRAEVTEEQVFGDAGGLGDFTRRGAAVVLAGEEVAGGVEQESPRRATGPARRLSRRLCRRLLLGRRSLGHSRSLLEPRSAVDSLG